MTARSKARKPLSVLLACRLAAGLTIGFAFMASPSRLTAQDAAGIVAAIENVTVAAIAKAEQSVVAIARVRRDRNAGNRATTNALSLGLSLGLNDPLSNPDFVPSFFGSGVVISEDGYIVTCAHVLGDPRENDYFVWLDRRSYAARVVGMSAKVMAADPFSDLAVLKIEGQSLKPIEYADASKLQKGRFVIALGNPDAIARDGQASASWGMISNLNRIAPSDTDDISLSKETIHQYGTLIQTDAKLNLGTSGGALVDLEGKLVGLTTSLSAKLGDDSAAGFAIAADELFRRVVSQLQLGKLPEFGFLGIQPEELLPSEKRRGMLGARVGVVLQGLPGDRAGLRPQDIIVQVDDQTIYDRNDLFRELSAAAAGQSVDLLVQRKRSDASRPAVMRLTAEVSKKLVQSSRPSFAIHANPKWRGLSVEYATAIPTELLRFGVPGFGGIRPAVAIAEVEPDSPAWRAGLRPGHGVRSVDGQELDSPEAFYKAISSARRSVKLEIVRQNGLSDLVSVPPESEIH